MGTGGGGRALLNPAELQRGCKGKETVLQGKLPEERGRRSSLPAGGSLG